MKLNMASIAPDWQPIIQQALACVDPSYIKILEQNKDWLPGHEQIFNAFTLPLNRVNYILFGESPYPRADSAIGYAFWDGRVGPIWSETGLAKPVNRATSLRHLIKMLLVADGQLSPENTSQDAIAALDKSPYVVTLSELFQNAIQHGILLLNASLVLSERKVPQDVKAWKPFMGHLLQAIYAARPKTQMILLGNLAKTIDQLPGSEQFTKIYAEHPYNVSFVNNTTMQDLFRPMRLLASSV